MRIFGNLRELEACVDVLIGVGEWTRIDKTHIDLFADVTEDRQWIHVDPVGATEGKLDTSVAHGFFSLSLVPALVASAYHIEGVADSVNYELNRVRFPSAVPAGSRVRASCKLLAYIGLDNGAQITVEVTVEREGSVEPACVAELVSHLFY